ncbi:hypothetical protein DEU31_3041 [Brachybacterium sp. AG952]|uniref:hypothetical protein n=1 Tax=Brachybacterium sp. AG952 TaxID=2183989 RepID=UPI001060FA95|nr:hypothetical protein [Brachybacterium sp. AG952]TDP76334.1 hypothetical protein DEU31_3041 [Brachybacterium sp. AG952]
MITEQTRRRRRGRAIRKHRRARAAMAPSNRLALDWLEAIWDRIRAAVRDALGFVQVLAARATPLPLTPRDGAGALRQLLEHGRAPRRGRRW